VSYCGTARLDRVAEISDSSGRAGHPMLILVAGLAFRGETGYTLPVETSDPSRIHVKAWGGTSRSTI